MASATETRIENVGQFLLDFDLNQPSLTRNSSDDSGPYNILRDLLEEANPVLMGLFFAKMEIDESIAHLEAKGDSAENNKKILLLKRQSQRLQTRFDQLDPKFLDVKNKMHENDIYVRYTRKPETGEEKKREIREKKTQVLKQRYTRQVKEEIEAEAAHNRSYMERMAAKNPEIFARFTNFADSAAVAAAPTATQEQEAQNVYSATSAAPFDPSAYLTPETGDSKDDGDDHVSVPAYAMAATIPFPAVERGHDGVDMSDRKDDGDDDHVSVPAFAMAAAIPSVGPVVIEYESVIVFDFDQTLTKKHLYSELMKWLGDRDAAGNQINIKYFTDWRDASPAEKPNKMNQMAKAFVDSIAGEHDDLLRSLLVSSSGVDVADLIPKLKERGYHLYVATYGVKAIVVEFMKRVGLGACFNESNILGWKEGFAYWRANELIAEREELKNALMPRGKNDFLIEIRKLVGKPCNMTLYDDSVRNIRVADNDNMKVLLRDREPEERTMMKGTTVNGIFVKFTEQDSTGIGNNNLIDLIKPLTRSTVTDKTFMMGGGSITKRDYLQMKRLYLSLKD